jgi:uncharacterized RDD family membrane protein YckC
VDAERFQSLYQKTRNLEADWEGAMYCSKCGANVPDSATFCGACGQPTGGVAAAQAAVAPVAGVVVRPGVQYAGFWLRFVAFIIDAIILGFVGFIITIPFMASLPLGGFMRGRPPITPGDLAPLFATFGRVALIRFVLNWLYYALLESSSWQATLGKKALGLEVTDLEGRRISFGRATGRFFGKIISALILFIGFIMIGFTEKKQGLHDMLAGCLVIRKV